MRTIIAEPADDTVWLTSSDWVFLTPVCYVIPCRSISCTEIRSCWVLVAVSFVHLLWAPCDFLNHSSDKSSQLKQKNWVVSALIIRICVIEKQEDSGTIEFSGTRRGSATPPLARATRDELASSYHRVPELCLWCSSFGFELVFQSVRKCSRLCSMHHQL